MPLLRVKLLSPLAAGSGLAQPGVVDRDVIHDPETGLVMLPARRLKGLLLDSYCQLRQWAAFAAESETLPTPDLLFGAVGDRRPGLLALSNARLSAISDQPLDNAAVVAELRAITKHRDSPIRLQDVLECYTEIRRQTAIDRSTGTALKDSLRYTRVLHEGLVFDAQFAPLPDGALQALALAAAGVEYMGTARSRGWGRVLFSIHESPDAPDLAIEAIERMRRRDAHPHVAPLHAQPVDAPLDVARPDKTGDAPTHRLRFLVDLKEPAMFPMPVSGDPNTLETFDHIPGTVIHGAIAARFLDGKAPTPGFQQLFCSGALKFLPAAPTLTGDDGYVDVVRIPHAVRKHRDAPRFRDQVAGPFDPNYDKRVPGWCERDKWQTGVQSHAFHIATSIHYHHRRAHDSRVQRALGSDEEQRLPYELKLGEQGALFVYESLNAGQSFVGEILGSQADLEELRQACGEDAPMRLGRSRSAQYGGLVDWKWLGLELFTPIAAASDETTVIVRLRTPMICRNKDGHPVAEFRLDKFIPGAVKKITKSFTRREFQGGYFSHQNLPKEQVPSLAAGSTFTIQVTGLQQEELEKAVRRSYGQRTEEGFGRIDVYPILASESINWWADEDIAPLDAITQPAVRAVAILVLKKQIERRVSVRARTLAEKHATGRVEKIRPHLVHRLIKELDGPNGLAALKQLLHTAHKAASKQLDGVRVENLTLREFLEKVISDPVERFKKEIANGGEDRHWQTLLGNTPAEVFQSDRQFVESVVHVYLVRYLAALARRLKKDVNN